jgi:hypothetical protein
MRHAEFYNCDAASRKSELECDKSGSCKEKPSRRAPDVRGQLEVKRSAWFLNGFRKKARWTHILFSNEQG